MNSLANHPDFVAVTTMTWQQHVKAAVRSAAHLRRLLDLPPNRETDLVGERQFATFAPLPFVSRMRPRDEYDPLLRQVLPTPEEGQSAAGYSNDPNRESQCVSAPGVLQKYPGRILLIAAKSCAVNCRYCFRRAFPYEAAPTSLAEWNEALAALKNDASIHEVVLSGGEPLINEDHRLAWLIDRIEQFPHVRRLRIHSRFPIVIPQRVTESLIQTLSRTRMPITFVVHSNHAQELGDDVGQAMAALGSVPRLVLLNQSVLLKGINDSVQALANLSWRLLELGVIPYYLHQLDRVTGSHHFEVSLDQGRSLVSKLRATLPGYAVPRFVTEIPELPSKQILL